MNRLLASILTALLALLAAPGAHATSVVLLDLETHLSESSAVVEATVGSQETSIDFESNKPVTDTTLQVVDVVYGDAPSELSVRQLKGKVGNIELHFPGAGDLVPGSRILVFLVHAEGHWWLTALAQSVFEVSGKGEDALAVRSLDELHLFIRDPDLGVLPIGPLKESPTKLEDLKTRVRVIGGGR